MLRKMLRTKIHRAEITQCDPDYVGSITIDADLLRAAGMRPNEVVCIYDIDNGARFETYIIRGEPGSGIIGINGAAARLVTTGDKVIIVAYAHLQDDEALDDHVAFVVVCDEKNRVGETLQYSSVLDEPVAP